MPKDNAIQKRIYVLASLAASFILFACGGDSASGEPLLSGTVTGAYDSDSFTAVNGFAITGAQNSLIGMGDGKLNCSSPNQSEPPSGMMGALWMTSLEVGTYDSVMVEIYLNRGSFHSRGSNAGTVEITASSAESIAGTVAYTDTVEGTALSLNGSFEVVRCAE